MTRAPRSVNPESGLAMVIVLTILAALLAGGAIALVLQLSSTKGAGLVKTQRAAMYCAEAGLAQARATMQNSYALWGQIIDGDASNDPPWYPISGDLDDPPDGVDDYTVTVRDDEDESPAADDPQVDSNQRVFIVSPLHQISRCPRGAPRAHQPRGHRALLHQPKRRLRDEIGKSQRLRSAVKHRQGGFSLVELMTVMAIVGVLSTIAMVTMNPGKNANAVEGYADMIAARFDIGRQRAQATGRYQRMELTTAGLFHYQATTTGLAAPAAWELIYTMYAPRDVAIHAYEAVPQLSAGQTPAAGLGLPANLDFSPDASSTGSTVYVGNTSDDQRSRVVVYGATAAVHAYDDW